MPRDIRTVVVCEAQVPFVRGGAEALSRELVREFRDRGYDTEWTNDSDRTPFGLTQTHYLQDHDEQQVELQFNGVAGANDRLGWTAGLFSFESESRAYNTTEFEAFNYTGGLLNFVANDGYTTENESAFVHVTYDVTERLRISGGARYTDEKKTNTFDHGPSLNRSDVPLLFGDSPAGELPVEVGAFERAGRREVEVPVRVILPVGQMTALPTAQGHVVRLELRFAVADGVPRLVRGDPVRLRQVVLNLLSNALKFTERGHVALRVAGAEAVPERIHLAFEVEDTGIGIPPDRRDKLFKVFSQVDSSTTRRKRSSSVVVGWPIVSRTPPCFLKTASRSARSSGDSRTLLARTSTRAASSTSVVTSPRVWRSPL